MLTGIERSAEFAPDGRHRWTATRVWVPEWPTLVAVMFNPSDANHEFDDPTVRLVTEIAARHGYGRLVITNGIPLVDSRPASAIAMVNTWEARRDWDARDRLQENVAVIRREVSRAGAVLVAWGALAAKCAAWFDHVLEQVREELPPEARLLCLGRTLGGYPKHPLARGKHKVRKDAPLLPWTPR